MDNKSYENVFTYSFCSPAINTIIFLETKMNVAFPKKK